MKAASSNQESLLPDGQSSRRDHFSCEVGGRPDTLVIQPDGTCSLTQASPAQTCGCLRSCFGGSPEIPDEVPAGNIVGVSQAADGAVQIWHAPLRGGKTDKPTRKLLKSAPIKLAEHDAKVAVQCIRSRCCWGGRAEPQRLLIIINPTSGPGRAPSIFEKQVKPVLEAAGLVCKAFTTMHRRHATEIIQDARPGDYDAIVSIGGDGTMYEVLQGLLGRQDWEAMRQTPLVQVPCGSGNALAASTGLWDPLTAAHAIVKGATSPLDIASVLQPPGRRYYSFLSLTFGLIPNLDIGTEHLRWMGGTRFIVGALQQILLSKSHVARVAILEADAVPAAGAASAGAAAAGSIAAGGSGSAAQITPGGAAAGAGAGAAAGAHVASPEFDWGKVEAATAVGPPLQHTSEFHLLADHATLEDFTLPPGWQWLPSAPMQLFTTCNLPRLDMNFLMAPEAQLDSGYLNLIWTPQQSRRKNLEIMSSSEKGQHMHLVQQHKVVAMALEPVTSGTWLVVDGEEVPFQTIFLEVHPSLCQVVVAS